MQEELATRLQGVRRQTTAEHIRKAARDLAVMGAACGLAATFWREALPEGSALWLAMAMPVSGLLYVAAVFHEARVRRATSSCGLTHELDEGVHDHRRDVRDAGPPS